MSSSCNSVTTIVCSSAVLSMSFVVAHESACPPVSYCSPPPAEAVDGAHEHHMPQTLIPPMDRPAFRPREHHLVAVDLVIGALGMPTYRTS
jgi:hypothetical protein